MVMSFLLVLIRIKQKYDNYSEEQGLHDHITTIEYTRATEVLKEAKKYITSTEQLVLVKYFLKYRESGVASPDGRYSSY